MPEPAPNATSLRIPLLAFDSLTPEALLAGLQSASCVFLTGIPALGQPLAHLLDTARTFFSLPSANKGLVRWSGDGEWAGWQPLFEGAGPQALLLERYELALPAPEGYPTPQEWAGEFDQWPERPADFIDAWTEYYVHMRRLASLVTSMLGQALDVPQADLAAWTDRQHSNLCVNHYIAQPDAPEEGRTRQLPHTDIGGVTLLWADDSPGGLEAEMADGSWIPIAFPPGALLVQAGDLLHLWSHGSIPANNHRVVNPPRTTDAAHTDRYSVVFFHHPDLETWVAPVIAQAGDTAMTGTTARDHVMERQHSAYA